MLPACKAIVIGHDEAQTRSLMAIARKVGFAIIEAPATGDVPTPRTLISFVLVHHQIGDRLLESTIKAIRGGGPDVRFSPIIVIGDDCDFETVLRFVHLGVDDVISLPENREVLAQRLGQQLWSEHLYIEPRTTLGPIGAGSRQRATTAASALRATPATISSACRMWARGSSATSYTRRRTLRPVRTANAEMNRHKLRKNGGYYSCLMRRLSAIFSALGA